MSKEALEALEWYKRQPMAKLRPLDKNVETIIAVLTKAALTPQPVEESEWLTSEPHTEYEMLKRQFYSMITLINSMGREISYYSKKSYETGEKHLAELTASLESERAMNAQLTEELERALAPQPVDMSSLRKEIFLHDDFSLTMQAREAVYWVLDHLAARGLIAVKPEPIEGQWQPIEEMGEPQLGKRYWLAAYIVPSEEAARNGSKPFWHVTDGLYVGKTWTGILGGKPSHYMDYITPKPPADI